MARALTYKGVPGSLVSIRSAAEQAFVTCLRLLLFLMLNVAALALTSDFWIGGSDEVDEGLLLVVTLWY
jgi:hypothetical protein